MTWTCECGCKVQGDTCKACKKVIEISDYFQKVQQEEKIE